MGGTNCGNLTPFNTVCKLLINPVEQVMSAVWLEEQGKNEPSSSNFLEVCLFIFLEVISSFRNTDTVHFV